MQVSRTLRCFRGQQRLRSYQLFRSFDDVVKGTGHYKQRHPCAALLLSYLRSHYSSVPPGEKDETLSPDASRPESATAMERSAKESHWDSFPKTSTSSHDGFDISELETKMLQPKRSKIQQLLTDWHVQVQKAKKDSNTVELFERIQPKLHSAVDMALKDTAPSEMRLKCLGILLHQEEDTALTIKLLKHILKDAQYLTTKSIADIVHLLSVSPSTDLRSETRRDLVLITVNKRWFEIGPKQIVFFLYQLDDLFDMRDVCLRNRNSDQRTNITASSTDGDSNETETPNLEVVENLPVSNANLENRLISLVDELKPKDLARVVTIMGKWRNRNQVLLQAVVHRLSLADMSDFSLIQLSNLLFACSILSIHSTALLDKTTKDLASREISSPALVSSLLSSLSHLRWYDASLVAKCLDYLGATAPSNDGLSFRDSSNILMSLANLYSVPVSGEEISVIKALGRKAFAEAKSSIEKVDTAWCLSILKLLDGGVANEVLDPSFVKAFNDDDSFQSRNALQKLQGISLAARFEVEGYEGPFMEERMLNAESGQEKSGARVVLTQSLTSALGKFMDLNSYVRVSQSLPGGLYADAVMCSGSDGSPKPLGDLEKEDNSLHRLAIQVVPFSGVLTSHPMPCGIHQMVSRHLHHLGYTAVQVPYSNLRKSQSVLEHVNAIQSLIKKAVCEGMTDSTIRASSTSPSPSPPSGTV